MSNDYATPPRSRPYASVVVLLLLGLALALACNLYQFVKSERLARQVTQIQHNLEAQITRLSDATSGAFDVAGRRFDELKKLQDSTAATLIDTRSELHRSNSKVAGSLEARNDDLDRKNRELVAQLTALKQDINTRLQNTSARLQNTTTKLDTANAKLEHVATEADSNRADLKRVAGDVSSVRASLAGSGSPSSTTTPAKIAAQPPPSPERKVFPFDLLTTRVPTRVGEIQLAIRSADPKTNRYVMDLYTGAKTTLGKDCAVNEAFRFYLSGNPFPYEIVVNQVRKDEVLGYVSAPRSAREIQDAGTKLTAVTR